MSLPPLNTLRAFQLTARLSSVCRAGEELHIAHAAVSNQIKRVAIFVLALFPRLWRLDNRPFWYDEVVTVQRASLPLRSLVSDSFGQHHLPFYFLLVAPFTRAHDLQFWMRFPSAVFGGLCVIMVYLIAERIAGRGAGIAAALILGLSPTEIAYAQEARSYTLEMWLVLVALHGLIGLVMSGERAGFSWRDPRAPQADWLWFITGTTFALCTLGDSLPWLLAADGSAAFMAWRMHDRPAILWNFLCANGIILVCCLPLYGAMLRGEDSAVLVGIGFVPKLTASLIWSEIKSVYLMQVCDFMTLQCMIVPTPIAVQWVLNGGLGAASAAGLWRLRKQPILLLTLLLAVVVCPLFLGFISIWHPILITRYILWSAASFAVIAGIGIEYCSVRLSLPARRLACGAGTVLLVLNLAPFYCVETKPRWDIAATILAAQSEPGDVVYLSQPISARTVQYYLPPKLKTCLITGWSGDLQHAIQAHAQGHRVWAIFGGGLHTTLIGSMADFQASLTPLGSPGTMERAGTRIYIWRFDPVKGQ